MCSQIYPDPQAEKAIMASVVYCIHHKEGCAWAGELRKLKVSTPSWTCVTFCHSLFACFSFHLAKAGIYFLHIRGRVSWTCWNLSWRSLSLLSQLGAPPPPGVRAPIDCTSVRKQPFEIHTRAGNTKSSNFREKGFYLFVPGFEWISWHWCDTFC